MGILWNRDIESIEILLNQLKEDKKNQIINIEEKEIFDLLESALFENRPEFVDLLIENFIDLKSFENERLKFLYENKVKLLK